MCCAPVNLVFWMVPLNITFGIKRRVLCILLLSKVVLIYFHIVVPCLRVFMTRMEDKQIEWEIELIRHKSNGTDGNYRVLGRVWNWDVPQDTDPVSALLSAKSWDHSKFHSSKLYLLPKYTALSRNHLSLLMKIYITMFYKKKLHEHLANYTGKQTWKNIFDFFFL